MRRVAGRREAVEAEHAVADDVDVLLRHRRELAPERVEGVAVQAARAALEALRVDEVRRADRARRAPAAPGCSRTSTPGGAGVVEVDVAEQQMADVGQREAAVARPAFSASTVVAGPQSKSAGPSSVSSR